MSAPGVESARNQALIFFMDHLMAKSGKRTIHDLSCQFGARGFTEDMREAVGGTQEALTAFLASYPMLFRIDGDEVSINQLGDADAAAPPADRNRDYEREAIEFFIGKLNKFGPEMPIKSLLGHRSQAAPEIRMISGRHFKDFVDFLHKHKEAFVVTGDRVRLANLAEPTDPHLMVDTDGQPLTGPRAKAAAIEYLRQHLHEQNEVPVPLEGLYARFCERFPHVVRQHVATNPKELLSFLKLNRQIFFIRSNKVSLVRTRPNSGDGHTSLSDHGSSGVEDATMGVVKNVKQAQTALHALAAESLLLHGRRVVALDCKFVTLGPHTPDFLSLVVVGTPARNYVVYDVAHTDTILLESGLVQLLQSDDICKVMHDCTHAAQVLLQRYNIRLSNVFDTQIAHQLAQHHRHNRPLHEVRPVSFGNLMRTLAVDVAQRPAPRLQVNWAHRPITDDSMHYICEQAVALVPQIYSILVDAVPPHLRPQFETICADRVRGCASPLPPAVSTAPSAQPYRPPHQRPAPLSPVDKRCCCDCHARPTADAHTQTGDESTRSECEQ